MRALMIAGLLTGLAGCASAPEPFTAPDGRSAYLLDCGGRFNSMAGCYQQARELCGGADYDILRQTEETNDSGHHRTLEMSCKRT